LPQQIIAVGKVYAQRDPAERPMATDVRARTLRFFNGRMGSISPGLDPGRGPVSGRKHELDIAVWTG
jgi:hypothetical protein